MFYANFFIVSPAVIESFLATLNPRQLVLLLIAGLIIGAGTMGSMGVVIRWALSPVTKKWTTAINTVTDHAAEWTKAFERIPPQSWFDEVKIALNGIAGQASELSMHAQNLLEIEATVRELEGLVKVDHEKLTLLKHDHDLAGVFGRRVGDKPGCSGLPSAG